MNCVRIKFYKFRKYLVDEKRFQRILRNMDKKIAQLRQALKDFSITIEQIVTGEKLPEKPQITISVAAQIIGLSPSSVRKLAKQGALKSYRVKEGGYRYFDRQEVEAYKQALITGSINLAKDCGIELEESL